MYNAKISVDFRNTAEGPWRVVIRELSRNPKVRQIMEVLWDYHREKVECVPIGQGYNVTFQPTGDEIYAVVTAEKWDISPEVLSELCKKVDETLKGILEPYLATLSIVETLCKAGLIVKGEDVC